MQIKDKHFRTYIPREQLAARIAEMGAEIAKDYPDSPPLFLCVLNGAFLFMADLARAVEIPAEFGFIRLSSYHGGMSSSGKVINYMGFDERVRGRHVIVVEDIVDTGLTMDFILKEIQQFEPASLKLAVLLLKREALKTDVHIDYLGFDIPNKFVVGYGLDYDEEGRNLADLLVLDE